MQEKLQQIKEIIWKANPSILELKFGCEVEYGFEPFDREIVIEGLKTGGGNYVECIKTATYGKLGISNIQKILGRKIGLADVLYSIQKASSDFMKEYASNEAMQVVHKWNLLDDNLDHQSEETITFLHNILCQK